MTDFVSIRRAARLLDCSRSNVYRLIQNGELKAGRVRRLLLLPASEVQRKAEEKKLPIFAAVQSQEIQQSVSQSSR